MLKHGTSDLFNTTTTKKQPKAITRNLCYKQRLPNFGMKQKLSLYVPGACRNFSPTAKHVLNFCTRVGKMFWG